MFGWFRRSPKPPKPVPAIDRHAAQTRVYALVLLAVLIIASLFFIYWYTEILIGDWCKHAVGMADKADARPIEAMGLCIQLMTAQLQALALNSHMMTGTLAIVVVALAVIVVAKGRVSATLPGGAGFDLGGDGESASQAAQATAGAAQEKADEITEAVGAPPTEGSMP